jgi:signal peptidase II
VGTAGAPVRAVQERRPAAPLTRGLTRRAASLLLAGVAAFVVVADQLTKTWAVRTLDDHDVHVVGTLRFHLTFNKGGAFSIATGSTWFFVLAAVLVIGAVLLFGRRLLTSPLAVVGIALVLGGALGNLGDRLFRDTGGAVVDFIDLQWWPIFNVADACIVVGGALLVLAGQRAPDEDE